MVIGNALLTIGAIGCVYAESVNFLLAARFVQGLGAATSAVVAFAIVADVYKGHAGSKGYWFNEFNHHRNHGDSACCGGIYQ